MQRPSNSLSLSLSGGSANIFNRLYREGRVRGKGMRVEDEIRISRESCCRDRRMRTRGYFMLSLFFFAAICSTFFVYLVFGKKKKKNNFFSVVSSLKYIRSKFEIFTFASILLRPSFFFFFVQTRLIKIHNFCISILISLPPPPFRSKKGELV